MNVDAQAWRHSEIFVDSKLSPEIYLLKDENVAPASEYAWE